MEIDEQLDTLASSAHDGRALYHVPQVSLEGINHRVYYRVGVVPDAVRVYASQRATGIAVHHAVHVHHGDYVKDVCLSKLLRNWRGAKKELHETLHSP